MDDTYEEERPARRSLRRLLARAVAVDGVDFMVGSIIIILLWQGVVVCFTEEMAMVTVFR